MASIEDHGYTLDFGIPNVSGFLSFKDADKQSNANKQAQRLKAGALLEVYVKKTEENGRMCSVGVGEKVASSEESRQLKFHLSPIDINSSYRISHLRVLCTQEPLFAV